MKDKPKKKAKILPFRKRTEKPFDVVAFAKKEAGRSGSRISD